jgi:hypothetical protein
MQGFGEKSGSKRLLGRRVGGHMKRISEKQHGAVWARFVWFRVGTSGGCFEQIMNLRVPKNVRKFFSS